MSFFKLFSGPSAEILENRGDTYFDAGHYGQALQAFEHAAHKAAQQNDVHSHQIKRITDKIRQTREALAREHQQNARNLIEGGYFDEAIDMLGLAMEISQNEQLRRELELQLKEVEACQTEKIASTLTDLTVGSEEDDPPSESPDEISDEDYFLALCGTLPESVQDEYLQYGQTFKSGYIALNRGDFQAAVDQLSRALSENQSAQTYIPLELATAYLNLNQPGKAISLLEHFLKDHPDTLPAYQLLCDIYWEHGDFQKVDELLDSIPDEFTESLAVFLLKGEALYRAGRFEAARDFYREFLAAYGWNQTVARQLAAAYEALDDFANARDIYKNIMGRCSSCQTRIDPDIKHRYAELCFADGSTDSEILEMYLSLVREIPEHAGLYYSRVSRIYAAQGNADEAARFRALASKAQGD